MLGGIPPPGGGTNGRPLPTLGCGGKYPLENGWCGLLMEEGGNAGPPLGGAGAPLGKGYIDCFK